jgi:hypothetical protein
MTNWLPKLKIYWFAGKVSLDPGSAQGIDRARKRTAMARLSGTLSDLRPIPGSE